MDRRIDITVKAEWIKVEVMAASVGTFQRASFQGWEAVLAYVSRARTEWDRNGLTSIVCVKVGE